MLRLRRPPQQTGKARRGLLGHGPSEGGWRVELAFTGDDRDWTAFAHALFGVREDGGVLSYADREAGQLRFAASTADRLTAPSSSRPTGRRLARLGCGSARRQFFRATSPFCGRRGAPGRGAETRGDRVFLLRRRRQPDRGRRRGRLRQLSTPSAGPCKLARIAAHAAPKSGRSSMRIVFKRPSDAPLAPAGAFRTAGVLFVARQGAARLGQSWLGVPARAALTGIAALADRAGLIEGGRGPIGLGLAVGFGAFQLSASSARERAQPRHGRRDGTGLPHPSHPSVLPRAACPGARVAQGSFADRRHHHAATISKTVRVDAKGTGSDLAQADYERLAEFRYLLRRFLVFGEEAAEEAA